MRYLSPLLSLLIAIPYSPLALAQGSPALNLVIVEGEGQINNIRQRTAREPIVEVDDENHKPIAGVAVTFLLPNQGASGAFADGSHSLTVITDSQGRAVARGLQPNHAQGQYQIHVSASYHGQTANAVITQSNVMGAAGAAAGTAAGISGKLVAVLIVVGAAAVGGGIYASTHAGSGNGSASTIPPGSSVTATTITVGAGTVGPPR